MATITLTYHPNVNSTNSQTRPVEVDLVRQGPTFVIVRIGGEERRLSKSTGREVGKSKFSSHYELPVGMTLRGAADGVKREWRPLNMDVLCAKCGAKADHHRGSDGRCPPTENWGRAKSFPRTAGDSKRELDAWDVAIAEYWNSTKTHYDQMR
jgi:hypothetical protein